MAWELKELLKKLSKSINKITLRAVELPLFSPYKLSFSTIEKISVIYAEIVYEDGTIGWGECTPLFGYSGVDFEASWDNHVALANALIKKKDFIYGDDGFNYCAISAAFNYEEYKDIYLKSKTPVVGLLQGSNHQELLSSLKKSREEGYSTYKIKVGGGSINQDLSKIEKIQKELFSHEKIRIDANQGFNYKDAFKLANVCSKDFVEVFEQPFAIEAWKDMAKLNKNIDIDLMLDESILGGDSLKKTISPSLSCSWIKLKLMKQGFKDRIHKMTQFSKSNNLKIVLGNGVSGYLGNFQEVLLWQELQEYGSYTTHHAIESNGFIKVKEDPFEGLLSFKSGNIICNEWRNPDFGDLKIINRFEV